MDTPTTLRDLENLIIFIVRVFYRNYARNFLATRFAIIGFYGNCVDNFEGDFEKNRHYRVTRYLCIGTG